MLPHIFQEEEKVVWQTSYHPPKETSLTYCPLSAVANHSSKMGMENSQHKFIRKLQISIFCDFMLTSWLNLE